MRTRLSILILLFLITGLLMAQAPAKHHHKAADQPCQLLSANPPGFNPVKFLPKVVDFKRLNRSPMVSYVVSEDGSVSNAKIIKGTRSPNVDAGLIESINARKYKPQPGCKFEASEAISIYPKGLY